MRTIWGLVAGVTGTLAMVAIGDLVSEEVRVRLDRVPLGIIRLASRRLPAEMRDEWTYDWRVELQYILRGAEALPVTRLLRGIRYAVGVLVWGAPRIRRDYLDDISIALVLTEQPSAVVTTRLEKARELVREISQSLPLHLEQSASMLEVRSLELRESRGRIQELDDKFAIVQGQMRPLLSEMEAIATEKREIKEQNSRMRALETALSQQANQKHACERRIEQTATALARPEYQNLDEELNQLKLRQKKLRDPWARRQELRTLAAQKRDIIRSRKRLGYLQRDLDTIEARERKLWDPSLRNQELRILTAYQRKLTRRLRERRTLNERLVAAYEECQALGHQSQQSGPELSRLRREAPHRERRLHELEEQEREWRARLSPFEDMVRMLKEEQRDLRKLARRQRFQQSRAHKQLRGLKRAENLLPPLAEAIESALETRSLSALTIRFIRSAWWHECARRRAMQQADGLGFELALEYSLYQALKSAGRDAGRQALVVILVAAWLGRLWQAFVDQSRELIPRERFI